MYTKRKLDRKKFHIGESKFGVIEDPKILNMFNYISDSKNIKLCENKKRKNCIP